MVSGHGIGGYLMGAFTTSNSESELAKLQEMYRVKMEPRKGEVLYYTIPDAVGPLFSDDPATLLMFTNMMALYPEFQCSTVKVWLVHTVLNQYAAFLHNFIVQLP